MDCAKEHQLISLLLSLDWMKTQSQLIGKYERWGDFKDYVIEPAINKINAETELSVIWEPIKKGRSVYAVKFSYVIENSVLSKPLRPRLNRRPKVTKGSHEEGLWMRKNLALLLSYQKELNIYDPSAKLNIQDLERMAEYAAMCDNETHKKTVKELNNRKIKATKK